MGNLKKNYFLVSLFFISLLSVLWLFSNFLKSAVVAWLLVMVIQRFSIRIESYFNKSKCKLFVKHANLITSVILTLALLLVIFVPLIYIMMYLISNLNYPSLVNVKSVVFSALNSLSWVSVELKHKLISGLTYYVDYVTGGDHLKQIWGFVNGYLHGFSQALFEFSLVIILFFMFNWYRSEIIRFIVSITPLPVDYQKQIFKNVSSTLSVVFVTIFTVAVVQGFSFGVLMLFVHYNPFLLGFLVAISSIIPIFGTALIWIPLAINEILHGNLIGAVVIAVYGSFVLSFLIDNFVRLFILNKISAMTKVDYKINEFILFFSIAAGIASFGFWGVLIGPALTTVFIVLSKSLKV